MKNEIEKHVLYYRDIIRKHSPEILTGIGITGMIMSTCLAVKATPKAMELLEKRKNELENEELSKKDLIIIGWKVYSRSISMTLASTICLIGATSINNRRNAALSAAYTLTNKAFVTYKDKVIETIGEKKEREINEKIAQDKVNSTNGGQNIIITQKGQTLCLDTISGRYFRSSMDDIQKIVNELNRRITCENYISLNEYYIELGLDPIKNGDNLGWRVDRGLIKIDFSATIANNDEPCIVLDYIIEPKEDYDR